MAMHTALRLAHGILNGFNSLFAEYQNITLCAKVRFEQADWQAVQKASMQRLELYKAKVKQTQQLVAFLAGDQICHLALWRLTKTHYSELISQHLNCEIAETFFNSIYCSVFEHQRLHDNYVFLSSSQGQSVAEDMTVYRTYPVQRSLRASIVKILQEYRFALPYENLEFNVTQIIETLNQRYLSVEGSKHQVRAIDVLEPVFFRNKAAYIVGRLVIQDGRHVPLVLPVMNNEHGAVYIDGLISDVDDVSVIFSFTRSYFMVDALVPSKIVAFLHDLLPHKPLYEIYSSIGLKKHGKTEFYRDFESNLETSDDQFVVAPGIKGMVMTVFMLPSYNIVFKVIKDDFTPPKKVTHQIVREKYRLVTRHERAGRMADTQEFQEFRLPRQRFSSELIDELLEKAASRVLLTETEVVIRHLYTERYMQPLNLFLAKANSDQVEQVMNEYGKAIKQLAAANIFAGDMLLKNFGVTRNGRVVFYDYDEITFLTDCNFRAIPEPQTLEQEMASQPWYSVEDNDVFPEEFSLFFTGNLAARKAFEGLHRDLYDPGYWQKLKSRIKSGEIMDVIPYRQNLRFSH